MNKAGVGSRETTHRCAADRAVRPGLALAARTLLVTKLAPAQPALHAGPRRSWTRATV
jgi:hypothetical protein